MSEDLRDIKQAKHDAQFPRKKHKYAFMSKLKDVNEPVECVALLKELNDAIDLMYELSDTGYYLDYIWNSSTDQDEHLQENGFNEDWFMEIAEKLGKLRGILFGDNFNFDALYEELYHELLGHEAYWSSFYEERWKEEERKEQK